MKEPLWREVLCWGTVITFLSAPLLVFILHLVSDEMPTVLHFSAHIKEYAFLGHFYQIISGLTFGLAGLNTVDKFKSNGKNGDKK